MRAHKNIDGVVVHCNSHKYCVSVRFGVSVCVCVCTLHWRADRLV